MCTGSSTGNNAADADLDPTRSEGEHHDVIDGAERDVGNASMRPVRQHRYDVGPHRLESAPHRLVTGSDQHRRPLGRHFRQSVGHHDVVTL